MSDAGPVAGVPCVVPGLVPFDPPAEGFVVVGVVVVPVLPVLVAGLLPVVGLTLPMLFGLLVVVFLLVPVDFGVELEPLEPPDDAAVLPPEARPSWRNGSGSAPLRRTD